MGPLWFANGGDATVYSYGVRAPVEVEPQRRFAHMRTALRDAVPARHVRFLEDLKISEEIGDYLFVHAGIRPEIPINLQTEDDMLWIRHEFTESEADHGKVVVHGHSVVDEPEIRENRINIDTGAYASHVLTCLALEGAERRFLSTG